MAYLKTRLGRWFYEERGSDGGSKTAIVLLHGLLFDGGMWTHQLGPLSSLGRVLVLDGPSHGKSEVPPLFTLEEHADALADALGELGIERAVLVGLSWGAMLAMRFALRHPSKVLGLALLDTSAEPERPLARLRYRAFGVLHETLGMPMGLFRSQLAPLLFCAETRERDPELVERTGRAVLGFDRRGVVRATLAIVNRGTIVGMLHKIRAKTLVLCGRHDAATPLERSEVIARHLPGARLVVIPRAGHMSPLEQSEHVNAELVPFVRSCLP